LLEGILTVAICIAAGFGFWAFMDYVRVHSMHYRLDEQGLSVDGDLWWRKPIPYWQIESARVISWLDRFLDVDRGLSSWFKVRDYTTRGLTRRFVIVRHRDGRVFILTPDDPEAFVRTVTERIAGTSPPKPLDLGRSSDLGLHDNVPGQKVPR
jgi:hypothetical protein